MNRVHSCNDLVNIGVSIIIINAVFLSLTFVGLYFYRHVGRNEMRAGFWEHCYN